MKIIREIWKKNVLPWLEKWHYRARFTIAERRAYRDLYKVLDRKCRQHSNGEINKVDLDAALREYETWKNDFIVARISHYL